MERFLDILYCSILQKNFLVIFFTELIHLMFCFSVPGAKRPSIFFISRPFCLFLGSGAVRGQSPVEWGEILYVHPSIRPSPPASWQALRPLWQTLRPLWQALRPLWQALRPLWQALIFLAGPETPLAGPQAALASPHSSRAGSQTPQAGPQTPLAGPRPFWQALNPQWMGGRTDVRTYGISPHSTGLRPLSGPLPCYPLEILQHQ